MKRKTTGITYHWWKWRMDIDAKREKTKQINCPYFQSTYMQQRKSGKQQNWCWRMRTYLEGYTEWTSVQQMGAESANDSSDFLTLPLLSATSSLSLRPPSLRCPCALRSRSVFFFPSISNLSPVPEDPSLSSRCFLISLVQNTSCLHPPHVAVGTPPFFFLFFRALLRSGAICWPCAVHEARGTFPATDSTVTIQAPVAVQVASDVICRVHVHHTSQLFLSSFQTADFLASALYQRTLLLSFTSYSAL